MNLLRPFVLFLFMGLMFSSFAQASSENVFETVSVSEVIQQHHEQAHRAILPQRDITPQQIRTRITPQLSKGIFDTQYLSNILNKACTFLEDRIWHFVNRPLLFLLYHLFLIYDFDHF